MDRESSPSSGRIWNYDAFLSFSDEDNCNSIGQFFFTLLANGVKTLAHEKNGEYCPPNLLKAIEECRVSIVVFSRNYAASTWCLEELAMIARCIDSVQQIVVPVFYDVHLSDVRHQTGVYHQAFAQHQERFKHNLDKVKSWRNAMTKVANRIFPNEELPVLRSLLIRANNNWGDEASSSVNELSEIQSHVEELENLLDLGSDDVVRIIGICGPEKTTLASALYERISFQFDARCFFRISLDNFMPYGAASLQNNLLREILKENLNIRDVHVGTLLMGTRLRNLKTLIVLDEVGHTQILEKLAGNSAWFGAGSRIIITTTNEYQLQKWGVDGIFKVKQLNIKEVHQGYRINQFNRLQIEVFLDIACFFVGEEINNVNEILGDFNILSELVISTLIEKSLISISGQRIQMHQMLQVWGRELARQDYLSNRLWFDKDTRFDMTPNSVKERRSCRALVLNPKDLQETPFCAGALSEMEYLRLLIIRNVNFFGVLRSLSNHLQHLSWHRFPFTCLPSSFKPEILVRLIMRDSNITQLWKELKTTLPSLESIDLRGSKNLMETPDFQWFPNLERVDLEGCIGLVLLHPSIACLQKLTFLNLRNCTSLESLPSNLFGLSSLEILNLAGCSKFAECLDFDNSESSIEEEVHGNQDLPLLEEIGKPLLACGIKREHVDSSTQDLLNSNDEYELENEFMNVGVHVSLDKQSQDDFATQPVEHITRSRKRTIQFPYRKSKKEARSSRQGDAPQAWFEASEMKAEAKRMEVTRSTSTQIEYPIAKCVVALDEVDGVPNNSYMKALEKFKDPYWREVFLTMSRDRKKAWLDSLV